MLGGLGYIWLTSSKPKTATNALVQTATVNNRVYSVTRLGQGNYLVSLVSTNGVVETSPTSYTFNQTAPLGEYGDPQKVAQLKADLPLMQVSFAN